MKFFFSIPEILAPLRAGTPNVFFPLKFCGCCWAETLVDNNGDNDDDEWSLLLLLLLLPVGIGDVGLEYDVVIVVDNNVDNDCNAVVVVVAVIADDDDTVDDGGGGGGVGTSDRILSNDPIKFQWLIWFFEKEKSMIFFDRNIKRNGKNK